MFYTYILYSNKLNSFYKGETGNITDRFNRHNSGYEKATQPGVPWTLVWKGEKATKSEVKLLERKLKNLSVKRTIEFILKYEEVTNLGNTITKVKKMWGLLKITKFLTS
jgi:putative endonuclease